MASKGPQRLRGAAAVLIPAYNEAEALPGVLRALPLVACGVRLVAVVIDDGSSDQTAAVAAEHGAVVAELGSNQGGGAALRRGFELAHEGGADYVVTMDADGQHAPAEIPSLLGPVVSGSADLAVGSRI